jgi:hypothetical protein
MTISIKPTASGSTIEQDGSTILTVDGSGNISTAYNLSVSGTVSSTGDVAFNTDTLYVDSTNKNVGIGTTTPTNFGSNFKMLAVQGSDYGVVQAVSTSGGATAELMCSPSYGFIGTRTNHPLVLRTNDTERMRINSNGNVLMGTPTEAANETRIVLSTNSGTTRWSVGPWSSVPTNFYITATSAAQGVYLSGTTATSWSGLSDERAKDIIEPIENAVEKVSTLRAVIGKYKSDNDNNRKAFLIAQDVQSVLPEAVSVANQETGYLGLAYTDVIPLIVAAIKELKTENDTLKLQLSALETRIQALESN